MTKSKSRSGNVDYQLLARRKVSDNLRLLADRELGIREKNAALRRLVRLQRYTLPYCFETLRKQPGVFDEVIAQVLQALGDPACLDPLSEVMLDPSVPDDTKAALLPVFQFYEVDMESLPWNDVFHDVRRVARQELQRLVLLAAADQCIAQQVLDEMDRLPPDGKAAYARYLGQTGLAQAVPFLAALGRSEDLETAQAAMEGLVAIGGIAAWRELVYLAAKLPEGNPARQWAVAAARECGEKLRHVSAVGGRKLSLLESPIMRPEAVGGTAGTEFRLEEAAVSAVDGAGNRAVWLAYGDPAHPRRSWQTIYLLVHDEKGIVLCFGSASTRRTVFRRLIQELRRDTAVLVGDLDYALTLVRDALWHNRRSQHPLPVSFHYWWRVLGLPDETPRPYTPRFSTSEREMVMSQVKPAETGRLLDYHEFDDWFLVEPAVYDWIDRFDSLREVGGKAPVTVLSSAADSETVRELLTPGLARWRRRLALMADFYRRAGKQQRFKLALATLLRFRPGQVEHLPFAVRMIQKSVKLARGNMREGFDPRLLPEAFGII